MAHHGYLQEEGGNELLQFVIKQCAKIPEPQVLKNIYYFHSIWNLLSQLCGVTQAKISSIEFEIQIFLLKLKGLSLIDFHQNLRFPLFDFSYRNINRLAGISLT